MEESVMLEKYSGRIWSKSPRLVSDCSVGQNDFFVGCCEGNGGGGFVVISSAPLYFMNDVIASIVWILISMVLFRFIMDCITPRE